MGRETTSDVAAGHGSTTIRDAYSAQLAAWIGTSAASAVT